MKQSIMKQNLKNDSNFIASRNGVDDFLDFQILIKGEDICLRDEPFLLIAIPSVIGHKKKRDAIRRTWIRASETHAWPRVDIKGTVKHVFFFGFKKVSGDNMLENLLDESVFYNDIVMADFEDTYRNLTSKMLAALRWMDNFCEGTEFFLKVDEDTTLDDGASAACACYHESKLFVIRLKHPHVKPEVVRSKNDPWVVSDLEYPMRYYPQYMVGYQQGRSPGYRVDC